MSNVKLEGIRVKEIHFVNKITEDKIVDIETKISSEVDLNENDHKCICRSKVLLSDNEADSQFRILVDMDGLFTYSEGTPPKEIHKETFKDLFPYIRALITNLTTSAGMPPLIINPIEMNDSDIKQ